MDERIEREGSGDPRTGDSVAGGRPVREEAAGGAGDEQEGVLTLVCFKCGREYYYSDGVAPEGLVCEKCGNTVFRSFFSHESDDDADRDFRDVTERDLDPDDPEGDALPGDLIDLDPERDRGLG